MKLTYAYQSIKFTGLFFVFLGSLNQANAASKADNEACQGFLEVHGMLTRAQFQCGFSKYSEKVMQTVENCANLFSEMELEKIMVHGAKKFDTNEREHGHNEVCEFMITRFPKVLAK